MQGNNRTLFSNFQGQCSSLPDWKLPQIFYLFFMVVSSGRKNLVPITLTPPKIKVFSHFFPFKKILVHTVMRNTTETYILCLVFFNSNTLQKDSIINITIGIFFQGWGCWGLNLRPCECYMPSPYNQDIDIDTIHWFHSDISYFNILIPRAGVVAQR